MTLIQRGGNSLPKAVSNKPTPFYKGSRVPINIPVAYVSSNECTNENYSLVVDTFGSKNTYAPYNDYTETVLTGKVNLNIDFIPFTRFGSNRQVITVGNLEFKLLSWERISQQDITIELALIGKAYVKSQV